MCLTVLAGGRGCVYLKQTDETGNYIWRRFLKYTSVAHGGMRCRYYAHQRGVMYVSTEGRDGPWKSVNTNTCMIGS